MHERLMFWHVDETRYNIDELSRATDAMAEKARERGVSSQDADALREAKVHMSVTVSKYFPVQVSSAAQNPGC
jgi:hypothetical protein